MGSRKGKGRHRRGSTDASLDVMAPIMAKANGVVSCIQPIRSWRNPSPDLTDRHRRRTDSRYRRPVRWPGDRRRSLATQPGDGSYKHVQAGGQHGLLVVSPSPGGHDATSHVATENDEHGVSGWGHDRAEAQDRCQKRSRDPPRGATRSAAGQIQNPVLALSRAMTNIWGPLGALASLGTLCTSLGSAPAIAAVLARYSARPSAQGLPTAYGWTSASLRTTVTGWAAGGYRKGGRMRARLQPARSRHWALAREGIRRRLL